MNFSKNDKINGLKTVLIAPLDWGLGHSARCIPVIKELQNYPLNIIIAAEGPVKSMLKQEFPHLQFIDLKGYKIKYSKNKRWFRLKLMIQLPKIMFRIIKEHRWLNKVIKELSINAVISDNRFGLFHHSIPCIYITHQLFIQTGDRFTSVIATLLHRKYIKNYTRCWIPDFEGKKNLAGKLSHGPKLPVNAGYIGCLSRFEKQQSSENTVDLLIILSGPEPLRSSFENVLLDQLASYTGKVLFVRGLPEAGDLPLKTNEKFSGNIVFKNFLNASDLNKAMEKASLIISRSGYTTIMDLVKLQRKAVLVPTPGQAEQEYLAKNLSEQGFFYTVEQENFLLHDVIKKAATFQFRLPSFDMTIYKKSIREFVESIPAT